MPLMVIQSGVITYSASMVQHNDNYHLFTARRNYIEKYINHLGNVDNFTQTNISGLGSATEDGANHEMDLATGAGVGHARYESKKAWTLSIKPIVANFRLSIITIGGSSSIFIGLRNDFASSAEAADFAGVFYHVAYGVWQAKTASGALTAEANIPSLASGDLVTIVATSSKIMFYTNGSLVATITTRIPTSGLKLGGAVHATAGAGGMALSMDMMGIEQHL